MISVVEKLLLTEAVSFISLRLLRVISVRPTNNIAARESGISVYGYIDFFYHDSMPLRNERQFD